MVKKQIMSIDSLYKFFVEQNKSVNFNVKDSGKPIVVTTVGTFSVEDNDTPDLLKLTMRVAHCDTNRNGSHISKENMQKFMGTLKYKPVLAYIHQCPPNNEWDFYAHNMEIVEDENGEEQINYLESQVGTFTADEPYLEYNEEMGKTYVMAKAVIAENYTKAADIIRAKGGTKISCELVINELSYNAKEKYLDLTDFYFAGCALLGRDDQGQPIGEGMEGARANITDFCHKESVVNYQENSKLIEMLDRLDTTLKSFEIKQNLQNNEEGGKTNMKLDELLAKYEVTLEEIDFEVEGLDDAALETAFEDFACRRKKKCELEDEPVTTEDPVPEEKFSKTFAIELSHEDVNYALYNLIAQYDEADNEYYFIRNVYDGYFIMQGWCGGKLYKQSYKVEDANVSLEGERQEMFELIVSESEKITIEKLRGDYADLEAKYNELVEFKANYDAAILKAQKDEILSKAEYSVLAEDANFKALIADAAKFSVAEIESKCKEIFADYVIKTGTFSAQPEDKPTIKTIGIPYNMKEKKQSAYGNLFSNK